MVPVAELMVQEHMSFSAACQAKGIAFDDSASERAAQYSDAFQNIVNALGFRFYSQIGDNPLLTKGVILGWLTTAVQRLGQQDQWDKVAIPAKLISDIMGLTKTEPNQPVIANLTQKDIDDIRQRLRERENETQKIVLAIPIDDKSN